MATSAASGAPRLATRPRRSPPALALTRRAVTDAWIRTIAFAYLFAAVAYINPVAYRHTYPTLAQRLAFAHSFGANKAVVLFYGKAYDLLTIGGYTAWRSGGTLAIFAAIFGLLAAVRALRGEEDAGRAELVLAGLVSRRLSYLASLAAIAAQLAVLWIAALAGLLVAKLPVGGAAYLALAIVSTVPVFAGVGALASQLAPTRRVALELGGAVVAIALVLRVIADTSSVSWLRWATPLGWAEALRPFTGARPLVLLAPLGVSVALLAAAGAIARGRDVGSGVLPARDTAAPRLRLLSSPTALALRDARATLLVWMSGVGAFAVIVGVISKSISSAGISKQLQRELAKLGSGSITTPIGYMSFAFIFFVLAVTLFVCAQVAAARNEEAGEQLETLLALPVGRRGWLGGRLALAAVLAAAIALAAGLSMWVGAALEGVHVSLARMLEAGANCLPVAILFLGIAALAYAILPRASVGLSYGLVAVAFLWNLFGALIGAPKWLVDATPFAHVGLIPAQPFRAVAAAVMVGTGCACAAAAIAVFERRDLMGA